MRLMVLILFLNAIVLSCSAATTPESNALRIAVVQQNGNPGQVDENRKKALGFAAKALAEHADIILFHEELLVGYVKNLKDLAEPVDGPTTLRLSEAARGKRLAGDLRPDRKR